MRGVGLMANHAVLAVFRKIATVQIWGKQRDFAGCAELAASPSLPDGRGVDAPTVRDAGTHRPGRLQGGLVNDSRDQFVNHVAVNIR